MNLSDLMKERVAKLAGYLDRYFGLRENFGANHERLLTSMRYSLLQEGSKRFRPVLAMFTAEALGQTAEKVLPLGSSIECIHTYSLIHDDLPSMDNDDMRRGQPTNHKKFDEATAILAGDALLTEAFQILASDNETSPQVTVRLVSELAKAAGLYGMVGGQAIDMGAKKEAITLDELRLMHRLKTGALIRVSAVGAAIRCEANEKQMNEITKYAEALGLAFQVADDILDYDPNKIEPGSYPALLGLEKTRVFLDQLTNECLESLRSWPASADPLREIARYNGARKV